MKQKHEITIGTVVQYNDDERLITLIINGIQKFEGFTTYTGINRSDEKSKPFTLVVFETKRN